MSYGNNVFCTPQTKTLYIHEEIDEDSISKANYFLTTLLQVDEGIPINQRTPIKIYINTRGGSVDDMWSLIHVIESSQTPIYTYCTGYAYSAGFLIFIAGHKRFMGKHALVMYHILSGGNCGNFKELEAHMELLTGIQDRIEKHVMEKTKIPAHKLKNIRDTKKDWYIRPKEAIKLGIADRII